MRQDLNDFAIIAWIIVSHFVGAYIAVAALFPEAAGYCGLTTAFVAMLAYLVLWWTKMDEAGLPLGLLILAPVIYLTLAAAWWLLRWLGLWQPFR